MREKFKHFCDTANPDLLRLVIIFVLVGLLLVGFLLFGRSDEGASILPAWVQTEHVEPPDERLTVAQKENPDTVAWITIPGTNIDAPVQQYGDNDYYLRRDEKGAEDYHGCLYADYACRILHSVSSGGLSVPRRSRHSGPPSQSSFCHSRSPLSAEILPHTHTHSRDNDCCPPQIRSKVRCLFRA